MSTRQQRRQAEREAAKNPRHGKSEVFNYTDPDGVEQWLAVEPLRRWAAENLTPVGVDIDIQMVERIVAGGRVTEDHVKNHTFKQDIRPILVADDFQDGRAEIVDGNHTYVAMAMAMVEARKMGFTHVPMVPAYCLEREVWTRFLVTPDQRG